MHKRSQDYSFEMDKSKDLIKNFKCEICEIYGVPENGPERKMSQIVKTENVPVF